jgi:hypothetical protein
VLVGTEVELGVVELVVDVEPVVDVVSVEVLVESGVVVELLTGVELAGAGPPGVAPPVMP